MERVKIISQRIKWDEGRERHELDHIVTQCKALEVVWKWETELDRKGGTHNCSI